MYSRQFSTSAYGIHLVYVILSVLGKRLSLAQVVQEKTAPYVFELEITPFKQLNSVAIGKQWSLVRFLIKA